MGLSRGATVKGVRGYYQIESLIGEGGLGRVWRARANNGSIVAIKEPTVQSQQDFMKIEKLQIEAAVLEKLTGALPLLLSDIGRSYMVDPPIKSHIVHFLDVDRVPSRATRLLILQFVDGIGMEKKYRTGSGNSLTVEQVDHYTVEVLKVVKVLHENNILHRDISPHNLISTYNVQSDPVLIDFGTAKEGYKQLSQPDMSQIVHLGYSAPELLDGQAFPNSDLYSVAATMLFLFTGTNPQYLKNSSQELDEGNKNVQKIPVERLGIIKKALSRNHAVRFQTAEDMIAAIQGRRPTGGMILKPHIVVKGMKYEISGSMVIGRKHMCGQDCRLNGFSRGPDVAINDPESYVARHNVKVRLDSSDACLIEPLGRINKTAVRPARGVAFQILPLGKEYRLADGDIIALAYSPNKGPYMTISFHAS